MAWLFRRNEGCFGFASVPLAFSDRPTDFFAQEITVYASSPPRPLWRTETKGAAGWWGLWSPTDLDWNPAVSFASDATLSSLSLSFFSYKMGVRKVYTSLGNYKNYMISYLWSTWHMALYFVKAHDRYVLGIRRENSDFLVSPAGEGTQRGWRAENLEEGCLGLITLSTSYY